MGGGGAGCCVVGLSLCVTSAGNGGMQAAIRSEQRHECLAGMLVRQDANRKVWWKVCCEWLDYGQVKYKSLVSGPCGMSVGIINSACGPQPGTPHVCNFCFGNWISVFRVQLWC